jgi:hypothetical protein
MGGSDCTDLIHCECVDSLYNRIKLLEQRVIDLQGQDDLSYIDKKLGEYSKVLYQIKPTDRGDHILESVVPTNFGGDAVNYVFRGRLEDCEIVRDQLVALTSQIQNKTGNTIHEQR